MTHSEKVLEYLYYQLRSNTRDDLIKLISNDEKEYNIHDIILEANSRYFEATVSSEFILENANGELLEAIVKFCYTGKLVYSNIPKVLKIASFFIMPFLEEECLKQIENGLGIEHAMEILLLSDKMVNNSEKLQKQALDIVWANFKSIPKDILMTLDAYLIKEIFASKLIEDTEDNINNLFVEWVKFDMANRFELMFTIRPPVPKYKQRYDSVYLLSVLNNNEFLKVEKFNHKVQKFEVVVELQLLDIYEADDMFILYNNKVYIFGRRDYYGLAVLYDLDTKEYERLPDMGFSRRYSKIPLIQSRNHAIAFGQYIYVFERGNCERFDTIAKVWEPIPCPCANPIVSVTNDILYAVDSITGNVYLFDPISLQWGQAGQTNGKSMVVGIGQNLFATGYEVGISLYRDGEWIWIQNSTRIKIVNMVTANGELFILTESGVFGKLKIIDFDPTYSKTSHVSGSIEHLTIIDNITSVGQRFLFKT